MKYFKKTIFAINLILVITNCLLIAIPFFALYFMMIMGGVQVIIAVLIGLFWNQLTNDIKTKWRIYAISTIIVLSIFYALENAILKFEFTIGLIAMIASIGLALLNLNITYLFTKINNHETINS